MTCAIWVYHDRAPDDARSSGFVPRITRLAVTACPLCRDGTAGTVPLADGDEVRWACLGHAANRPLPMLRAGAELVGEVAT